MNQRNKADWLVVNKKGQVTIPKPIREHLGMPAGTKIRFRRRYDGIIVIEKPSNAAQVMGRLRKYIQKPD